MRTVWLLAAVLGLLLSACTPGYKPVESIPRQDAAYRVMDDSAAREEAQPYRIGPDDTLRITTFFEPELSVDNVKVDRSGQIAVPAIGSLVVENLTPAQLASQIENSYRGRLLVHPQVAVAVVNSAARKVTVTGQVNQPGVYDVRASTSLLEALALARGESEIAKLNEVVIFRTINGERMAARFDISAIRSGAADDPRILGNDLVVVGYSAAKKIWRDIRQLLPLVAIFQRLRV